MMKLVIKNERKRDMILFKARTVPTLLRILRILNTQLDLSEDEQKYYYNQEKGYEGEVQFDLMTEKLQNIGYILNDLLLEVNNTSFQTDTQLLFQDTIYLIDVKNFEGEFEYCYTTENLKMLSGKIVKNPLDQLKRSKSLFQQLLQNLGCNLKIEAYVIFINPEFTLYQAPPDIPFILPTQINRFLKKLETKPSRLNSLHKKLAEKLVSLHMSESPYIRLPKYEYNQLKKGNTCKECQSFSMYVRGKNVVCCDCGFDEFVETAVIRNVEEIKLLFPEIKITTNTVHEWCGVIKCKKRISRILTKNYKVVGGSKCIHYE
jgi:hypothetical protein